jgi:tetratricopeptide (TPR) repeat protein
MTTLDLSLTLQSAFAAFQRGDLKEAERIGRSVLSVRADQFEALFLLGIIAGQAGRPAEAVDFLSRAIAANPSSPDAHFNRGVALGELGRGDEALDSYDRVLALNPSYAEAHFNRGVVLGGSRRWAEAIECYDRAIALRRDYAEAHHNRGVALVELGRPAEALESYERAIDLRPSYAAAYNNRGVALAALGRLDEALESYDSSIRLKPDYAGAYDNRGVALLELDRAADALASHERALALRPEFAEAHYNRGNALRELSRHREAIESFERVLALRPDHASAHWNLADCLLLLGEFARGWQEYEWRWKLEDRRENRRDFAQPLWLGGEPLAGKTILLHSELGLGDTILFCRYATRVAAAGAKVVLEVQPALLPIMIGLEGVALALPRGAPLPAFDAHCPLMSLPLAFKTDLATIPSGVPYLGSDAERVAAWIERLGTYDRPRVGLVWSGSVMLKNDRRSMPLAQMVALLSSWAQWVSLQKDVPEADAALLASRSDVLHVGDALHDFAETAAVLTLMDLVITVDTSVANLAGAMGKPVWILLPYNPHDWRWMLERRDSPWYPTARLFRQPSPGDWASVIERVREELALWVR